MGNLTKAVIAGAAGTTALNATTYLDMAVRARGGSSTPEDTVQKLADEVNISLGEEDEAENRKQGLGALMGYGTGIGAALCYAALASRRGGTSWPVGVLTLGTFALLGSNVPMTALGITDPRAWSVSSWVSDIVPHMIYGAAAYAAWEQMR
ncbi:hypothetical protein E1200_08035 [Actinomadura sp. GC306]|uniref:hypothetical protein n=1 Tax=Actinomadura sp. GC306 TaxID=2530367 RepID=UPI00104C3821|nr:hypothetical protein [Actinomadura sp. GC306]TDC69567.1 hypothetical protein E1200_08035 [Actinomadura sp. GC306]